MDEIVTSIKNSKKYSSLYIKTIERIVKDCIDRYGMKRAEDEARKQLHQIWGAYYSTRPDFEKLIKRVDSINKKNINEVKETLKDMLKIHSSTSERVDYLDEFYTSIFKIIGEPKEILDIGCGFNPLTLPWMNISKENLVYWMNDIDGEEINFLSEVYKKLFPNQMRVIGMKDVLVDKIPPVDVIFLFKILPVLEQQQKGATEKILEQTNSEYVVVSFPLKSISGKNVGMESFYSEFYEPIFSKLEFGFDKIKFENELVYILKSKE